MNEQANKVLAELLQKASNGIDAAVSFSQAQIPDVIHQLLVWNSVSSALAQIVGILIIILPIVYSVKKWELICDNDCQPFMLCHIITLPIGLLVVAENFDWLKIWLAPKLYLIEYAASLMK